LLFPLHICLSFEIALMLANFLWDVFHLEMAAFVVALLSFPILLIITATMFSKKNKQYINKFLLVELILFIGLAAIWYIAESS